MNGSFLNLDSNSENSIFRSIKTGIEWGLPKISVPLEVGGFTWLILDHRESLTEPKVSIIETGSGNSLFIANSFDDFLSSILPYKDVYDEGGNMIYDKESRLACS